MLHAVRLVFISTPVRLPLYCAATVAKKSNKSRRRGNASFSQRLRGKLDSYAAVRSSSELLHPLGAELPVQVEIGLPDGDVVVVGQGAIIGRSWFADLQLNDARVSEAHALISLRGRDVKLLALRGRFGVDGKTRSEVVLTAGMTVAFAGDLELQIIAVRVPELLLALSADQMATQILGGVSSVFVRPTPRVQQGWDESADVHIWNTGSGWMRSGDPAVPLKIGDTWLTQGVELRAVGERTSGVEPTMKHSGFDAPLTIVARFDTVHISRQGEPMVVVAGNIARVISELVVAGTALPWLELAERQWGGADRTLIRRRWDMQLVRLRARLREAGIRDDLVRADGTGLIELVLRPEDTTVDDT